MKASLSLVSIFVSFCLTGVQAELPYNVPQIRRDNGPPVFPPNHAGEYHLPSGYPHHSHTSYPTPTGQPAPTGGYPHYHHQPPRDLPKTFVTVTGTGSGYPLPTGGFPFPTGSPNQFQPTPCETVSDCKDTFCAQVGLGVQCSQKSNGKFCGCTLPSSS
ncbi:uncharacterized protein F4822DRAFT_351842 [Hypoxylon trugodes]|uniref:uncharacterized protein n=1 Tax=Hypoxylon trugodes TaxID=326681 RepID=UPI0021954E72|nr:uncharacterized protein F4822DRAFT_351842 [Hypoxylon trugodes]KAI1385712.1 hypothetical protein F4822DRAFT_351842 [Hypoxylon trugodes]